MPATRHSQLAHETLERIAGQSLPCEVIDAVFAEMFDENATGELETLRHVAELIANKSRGGTEV